MTQSLKEGGPPLVLDRYEIIDELASGGMATVYLARLGGLAGFQRLVAIKRLHPHLQHEHEFVQMFLDEARLAARIHHPNVVPILEVGASDAGYYLVMEYVEGDTLARLVARAMSVTLPAFPPAIAVRIMLDALEGLHAAHELTDEFGEPLHLVHRDVSPQNILVATGGQARITDFGVARALSRLSTTRAGQLKGKLAYMAPEHINGSEMDRRADVFSAGVVLWEALTMKRLFKGETDAETLSRALFRPIPTVRQVEPSVPAELDQVVMRALARDPAQRYASCLAFAEDLERAARQAGAVASVRDVASFVTATMAREIQAQRDKVRAWLSRGDSSRSWQGISSPSSSNPASSVSAAAMAYTATSTHTQPSPEPIVPAPRSRSALVLALSVSSAVAVAIPLTVWLTKAEPAPSAAVAGDSSAMVTSPVASVSAQSEQSASVAEPSASSPIASASTVASQAPPPAVSAPVTAPWGQSTPAGAVERRRTTIQKDASAGEPVDPLDLTTNPYR